jgi:hypothetical protein
MSIFSLNNNMTCVRINTETVLLYYVDDIGKLGLEA